MKALLGRAIAALGGAVWASILVGMAAARLSPAGQGWAYAWRAAGLLSLFGVGVGVFLAMLAAFGLTAGRRARWAALVGEHPQTVGAVALLVPPASVLWLGAVTSLGRFFFTAFHHVGLAVMAQGVTLLGLTLLAVAATGLAVSVVRRFVRADGQSVVRALVVPLAAGLVLAVALFAHGVFWGNVQGTFAARALLLSPFGVLKKPELDLTPVTQLGAIVLLGALLGWATRRIAVASAAVALVVAAALLGRNATHFGAHEVAAAFDARPSLVRSSLRLLRARSDRDHDGFSRYFGGADCDDRNPAINPDAVDRPANGVDEDCSGLDARPRAQPTAPAALATTDAGLPGNAPVAPADTPDAGVSPSATPDAATPTGGLNLVLITVDTLRWDMHFAGNPNPISPNLDRLAAQSVVFERGYALSSYTGRAIGPMLTGRYPTECPRDAAHFTRYLPDNVFLAERAKDAGFHTFGAASHFYFERRFGLSQGVDVWDTSAIPGGDRQETSFNDFRVADRAIAMLRDPETTRGRFALWAHFFDPHKQYVDHPELPLFGRGERARYEREVMSTDVQIGRVLDALDALPGDVGRRTVVVVTADHGEAFNEHGMSWHGVELWEELVRVPWVMRVPGVAPRRVSEPRGQIDLTPTLVELLGLPAPVADAPDAFSGVSLVPDLQGRPGPARPIYIELPEGPFNSMRRSLVVGTWKLTERGARRFELYNLATDPGERTNLAATAPAELARMRAEMESVRSGLRVVAPR